MFPSLRTSSTSPPSPSRPAPSLRLLASMALLSCAVDTPSAASLTGSGTTSKLWTLPPKAFTSATPGTARSAGRMTQSSRVRRSSSVMPSASIVNMYISPNGVVTGAMPPLMPEGRSPAMFARRSDTCWRAQ
jgi:hypothetical protein